MDKEYGTMFKQLIHERNELRKYIIDICKSLDINTSQSVLGANCLEFYAVLSSVAKDKIKDLQEQLKRKEQECNKLYIQLKADEEYHKEEENTLRKIIKNKEERSIELCKENNKLKQTLIGIKEIAEENIRIADLEGLNGVYRRGLAEQILQKINEVGNE